VTTNKGHQALQDYLEEIQKIVKCVANDVCYCYRNAKRRQAIAWSSRDPDVSEPLRLKRQDGKVLFIDIGQEVEDPIPTNSPTVTTKYYLYSILDAERKDLIGFHYHPELDDDPVLYPHIHVYADADERYSFFNLHKRHIPSGRVPLEDVIEWLIVELDVKPLREDWQSVLKETREKFKQNRTWS
jgi:hypothetical protein